MKSRGPRSRRENQANERSKALLTGNVVSRIVHHRGRQGEYRDGNGIYFNLQKLSLRGRNTSLLSS